MTNRLQMSADDSGLVLALAVLAGFVGSSLAGFLGNKVPLSRLLFFGLSITVILALMATQSMEPMNFSLSFIGFVGSVYFVVPCLLGIAALLDIQGGLAAMAAGALTMGTAIGPMIGGVLVEQYGYSALGVYFLAIGTLSAVVFRIVLSRS